MKKEKIVIGASAVMIVAIIAYFLIEKRKRESELLESFEKERKIINQEKNALSALVSNLKDEVKQIINNKTEFTNEIKSQLIYLIEKYKDIDERVTNELLSVSALIDIKQETKAIMALAKIIENLLKKIYSEDKGLKSNPRFVDLIMYAKNKKIIEKDEYHFLNGIREVRNEEAHSLSVRKEYNIVSSSLLIGISIVFKFAGLIKCL